MALLLKNARYIHWDSLELYQGDILVEEGPDGGIHLGKNLTDLHKGTTVLDCNGCYVTKSFAVGHHHVYSALARGMPAPAIKPANFREILQYIWWTLDKALDEEMIRYSALVTAIAAAKSGATFVIDHHASPNSIRNSLFVIAEAFESIGVSHLLCYEVTDRDGKEKALEGLRESADYLKLHQGLVGLHASFTVSQETLEQATDLAKTNKTGLHVHVAEDGYDQEHCVSIYGKRVVERFHQAGVLELPASILVHCLHLDQGEKELIRNSPCWMAENMESNLKNKVGLFDGRELGSRIMLGTDGMHSDMLQSARYAYFSGLRTEGFGFGEVYQRFRNVHRYIASNGFTGDGPNNLVVLGYDHHTPLTQENLLGHLFFGMQSGHVRDVISGGKLIVKNRELLTADQEEVFRKAGEQAKKLWNGMQGQT